MTKTEVIVEAGEDASGLAMLIAGVLEENLKDPKRDRKAARFRARAVIELTDMDIAVTLIFEEGTIRIVEGKDDAYDLYLGADYLTLADVTARRISAMKAMRAKKLKTDGSLFKLLKFQKILLLDRVDR